MIILMKDMKDKVSKEYKDGFLDAVMCVLTVLDGSENLKELTGTLWSALEYGDNW